jgi:hypothetical protein
MKTNILSARLSALTSAALAFALLALPLARSARAQSSPSRALT